MNPDGTELGFDVNTLAIERSQFLYRKLGYQDCGALILPNEPLEIILRNSITPGDIFLNQNDK
jgi:hypothetical protein